MSREVVQRNTIKHPVIFQNKIHSVHGGSYFPALHLENYIMGRGRPEVNRSEVFRRHFTPLTPWTRRYSSWQCTEMSSGGAAPLRTANAAGGY